MTRSTTKPIDRAGIDGRVRPLSYIYNLIQSLFNINNDVVMVLTTWYSVNRQVYKCVPTVTYASSESDD